MLTKVACGAHTGNQPKSPLAPKELRLLIQGQYYEENQNHLQKTFSYFSEFSIF